MERQECRRAQADGDLPDASGTEKQRPEPAEQPIPTRQVWRPLPTAPQHDQLLLEQEILGDHRTHATPATQLRGHDGQVDSASSRSLMRGQRRADTGLATFSIRVVVGWWRLVDPAAGP